MKNQKSTGKPIGKIEPFGVYDIKKASVTIGVSPRTLQQYIREGKVPAKRFGKEYRIVGDNLLNSLGSISYSGMQSDDNSNQNVAGAVSYSEFTKVQK